ncbi:hypothetical protein [Azospirillum sp.]|uniref:hypothetical protein n=1 Tax=Azospirillum sp. TaxID=34012 RepID=UPI002D5FB8A9|nr:hypothetical protein [Azospirillum sp.]HYD69290.1 hypothetical protein [Azospirillum sp.]
MEDEVAASVAAYFERKGGKVLQLLTKGAPGADVIIKWQEGYLVIEAKGGGSQKPSSARFGEAFTRLKMQQSWDAAVAQLPQIEGGKKRVYVDGNMILPDYLGIAVPDTPTYRMMFDWCRRRLEFLGDGVWFVEQNGTVHEALAPRLVPAERRG